MKSSKITAKTMFSPAREAEIRAAEARSVARLQGSPAPFGRKPDQDGRNI